MGIFLSVYVYSFHFILIYFCFECQVLKCVVIFLFSYRKNTECHFWVLCAVCYSQGQWIPVGYRQMYSVHKQTHTHTHIRATLLNRYKFTFGDWNSPNSKNANRLGMYRAIQVDMICVHCTCNVMILYFVLHCTVRMT